MREETERPEVIDEGCAVLVGTHHATIVRTVQRLMTDEVAYRRMQASVNPFGDGRASQKIVRRMAELLEATAEQEVPNVVA